MLPDIGHSATVAQRAQGGQQGMRAECFDVSDRIVKPQRHVRSGQLLWCARHVLPDGVEEARGKQQDSDGRGGNRDKK